VFLVVAFGARGRVSRWRRMLGLAGKINPKIVVSGGRQLTCVKESRRPSA